MLCKIPWDTLPIEWSFSYEPTIVENYYSSTVTITSGLVQPAIGGTIQQIVCSYNALQELRDWFVTGEKLVSIPIFNRCPVDSSYSGLRLAVELPRVGVNPIPLVFTYGTVGGGFYHPEIHSFSSYYVDDPLYPSGDFPVGYNDPFTPFKFKVKIVPTDNQLIFERKGAKYIVQPIKFTVIPRKNVNS